MRLHEAIEQAGEGGKIKRKEMLEVINIGDKHQHLIMRDDSAELYQPYLVDLTATDWEVVEDEVIEVGDTCTYGDDLETMTLNIIHINPNKSCVSIDERGQSQHIHIDHLTLIRKGPKVHTFEGVAFKHYLAVDVMLVDMDRTLAPKGLSELGDNGKTYDMTLVERVEPELDGRN